MRFPIIACIAAAILTSTAFAQDGRIKLPSNYKTAFTNYLTLDRIQHDDQIIRLYANDIAMKGMKKDGRFPNGSVLVGEVYKAKKDKDGEVIESLLGRRIPGAFALIAIMEKQAGWGAGFGPEHKNGDWDFAAFKPDGSVAVNKNLNDCRACHAPLTEMDHVFSVEHFGGFPAK